MKMTSICAELKVSFTSFVYDFDKVLFIKLIYFKNEHIHLQAQSVKIDKALCCHTSNKTLKLYT